jgi:DNA processing protein
VIVEALGSLGASVVSGGARGIDGDVHRAALAAGVPQIAIIPSMQDDPYPPEHARLFEAVAATSGSGVAYTRGPSSGPSRGRFVSRNRLVVAASRGVVVIESRLRSGSRTTGAIALTRGRAVLAMTGSAGNAALIGAGARVLPREVSASELAALAQQWWARPGRTQRDVPAALREVAEHLRSGSRGWVTPNDFGDPLAGAVALVEAEADGIVVEVSPGRYALA